MLDISYLLLGLDALSRAHEMNYFVDGHKGAAILAGVYLCREQAVEADVPDEIAALIDAQWSRTPLCAPWVEEEPDPSLLDQIAGCLGANLGGLRQVGHNVIFASLALKALRELPQALTSSRVAGICHLIGSFTVTQVPMSDPIVLPPLGDAVAFAESVLEEFVACTARFLGRGQGWSGHLLTYAQALMDLQALGYTHLAEQARDGFSIYVRRIRVGPQATDGVHAEHGPMTWTPLQPAYWREHGADLRLGHVLKYPYGFYALMDRARDRQMKRRCLDVAYRVL